MGEDDRRCCDSGVGCCFLCLLSTRLFLLCLLSLSPPFLSFVFPTPAPNGPIFFFFWTGSRLHLAFRNCQSDACVTISKTIKKNGFVFPSFFFSRHLLGFVHCSGEGVWIVLEYATKRTASMVSTGDMKPMWAQTDGQGCTFLGVHHAFTHIP